MPCSSIYIFFVIPYYHKEFSIINISSETIYVNRNFPYVVLKKIKYLHTINIFYIFAKTIIKMKENEIARLFIRFIREKSLKIRYSNDLFEYLMTDSDDIWDEENRKRFKKLGYNIIPYISHECTVGGYHYSGYKLPLFYGMTWMLTKHGHDFWCLINSKWENFYYANKK